MKSYVVPALLLISFAATFSRAGDWPQWRGPHFNGSCDETNLPDKLDKSTQAWATPLPGVSAATPVVAGGKIFLSSLDKNDKLLAMCVQLSDGKTLWTREVGVGPQKNNRNQMATPSPVTDGKIAIFYYGTGDLAAFDMAGKQLWTRNIVNDYGKFNIMWLYGSSPLLYDGKLYIEVIHRVSGGRKRGGGGAPPPEPAGPPAESYLLAIDPNTGKDLWKHARPSEAVAESLEAYTTPIPITVNGSKQILVLGGDCVSAHDPESGTEIWRCGGWNPQKKGDWRIVPSPLVADGLVIACPPKGGRVFAVKPDGKGDVTESHIAWKAEAFTSDVCVPLFYKEKVYVFDGDRKTLGCMDPKTGKKEWSGDLGGGPVFRASPTGADGKIYCVNEEGDVWVCAADNFKILSKNPTGDAGNPTRSTIAVADGKVIVRTASQLIAFGAKK